MAFLGQSLFFFLSRLLHEHIVKCLAYFLFVIVALLEHLYQALGLGQGFLNVAGAVMGRLLPRHAMPQLRLLPLRKPGPVDA